MNAKVVALDLSDVFTQEHFLVWLDAQECWSKSIPKNDFRHHSAIIALDLVGRVRVKMAINVQKDMLWNDGGVRELALQIDKNHSRADGLKVTVARSDSAKHSMGKRGLVDLRARAIEEYRAKKGPPQTFAKAFAEEHNCNWLTVKGWLKQGKANGD